MIRHTIIIVTALVVSLFVDVHKTFAADFFNETCTSLTIRGRPECVGYFTGDPNAQAGGTTMFPMPSMTDVFDRSEFINKYQSFLNSGDERLKVGAAGTITIMLGLPGTTWGNNKAAGIQYAKDNFGRWANLVTDYDNRGLVDWDYNESPIGPHSQSGYSNSVKDVFNQTSETIDSILVFRFRNPNGNPADAFLIDKWCGNIKGEGFIGAVDYTLSGSVYIDNNRNGLWDGTDTVYTGGTNITRTGASGGSTTSNGSGGYAFTNLLSGNYTVSVTVPPGYTSTTSSSRVVNLAADNFSFNLGIAPLYKIMGNVFVDANKNGLKDNGEPNYSGTPGITASRGTVTTGANGAYTISNLTAGSVTVSYSSLSSGYTMTYPLNGPPPSFQVTVGPGCDVNGTRGASCQ